jgi:UDP-N-acetylglucosamine 2-epimerase (non-hydrolysing)
VGSGTHAEQTGRVMIAYEKILMKQRPDLVIVVGDVNSTLACTLAASKIRYPKISDKRQVTSDEKRVTSNENPVPGTQHPASRIQNRPLIAHLEAGLRSFDRTMPEEINRLLTDALADILWTPSPDADENLMREGVVFDKVYRVGNIMIDSLEMLRPQIQSQAAYEDFNVRPGQYGLVTLHRPSNVDNHEILEEICRTLSHLSQKIPLIFSIHPRTKYNLKQNRLMNMLHEAPALHVIEPLNYIRFMNLLFNCRFAITDSGGIQEETTYLGIPCLTLRPNTERPITIDQGTNQLCSPGTLENHVISILEGKLAQVTTPEFWDGKTAKRVVQFIKKLCKKSS